MKITSTNPKFWIDDMILSQVYLLTSISLLFRRVKED